MRIFYYVTFIMCYKNIIIQKITRNVSVPSTLLFLHFCPLFSFFHIHFIVIITIIIFFFLEPQILYTVHTPFCTLVSLPNLDFFFRAVTYSKQCLRWQSIFCMIMLKCTTVFIIHNYDYKNMATSSYKWKKGEKE